MDPNDSSDNEDYSSANSNVENTADTAESSDLDVSEVHSSDFSHGESGVSDHEGGGDGVQPMESSDDDPLADDLPLARLVPRWSIQTHPVNVQQFTQSVGPNHDLEYDASALEYFYLLFDEARFEDIANETNRYAAAKKEAKRRTRPTWDDPLWFPTTAQEVKAFFGMNILMGIHALPQYACYWSSDEYLHVESVAQIMSKTR
jgi:hypothetical protein